MPARLSTSLSKSDATALIAEALELAKREDLSREGDVTTNAIVEPNRRGKAKLLCKQRAMVAGLATFELVFRSFDAEIKVTNLVDEGAQIDAPPQAIALVEGSARAILTAERLALNLVQRMSAVATVTSKYVALAKPAGIAIRDTRKTTPGLRIFEREAVAIAGGENHRFGLFDAILIKDNHIEVAGSIDKAIELARRAQPDKPIQAEAATLEQVQLAVKAKVDSLLLDNMTPDMVRQAVALIDGACFIEVSGGINLTTIENYLIAGVNAISVGALTHSAPSIDLSLEMEM